MDINKYLGATASDSQCLGIFDFSTSIIVIIVSCVLGIAWAIVNYVLVKKIDVCVHKKLIYLEKLTEGKSEKKITKSGKVKSDVSKFFSIYETIFFLI